jgi:hypothetical protein
MNHFSSFAFYLAFFELQAAKRAMQVCQEHGFPIIDNLLESTRSTLEELQKQSFAIGLANSNTQISDALAHIGHSQGDRSASAVAVRLEVVEAAIRYDLSRRHFLWVNPGRNEYLDQDALFGDRVRDAFPSAISDLREAGNCLAAECNTAAVFHLMRAVEWGLRALCANFGFTKAKSLKKSGKTKYTPIPYVEWEIMLNQLQPRVDAKLNKIKRGPEKQAFQEYYYPILQDMRAVRDAWRNHVMHTRATYGHDDAEEIYRHVKRLLVVLSQKVLEC